MPTLGTAKALQTRLAQALYEIADRDRQIMTLQQQLEVLSSDHPSALESGSPPSAHEPMTQAQRASESSPSDAVLSNVAPTPEPTGRVIQWHSVTIGDAVPDDRSSLPPSQRKDLRRAVELEVEFDLDTQFYAGLTQDVSEGGVFIATYRIQPIGTLLGLSFSLPDGTKVAARGEVRWIRDTLNAGRPGMGVAFTQLCDEALVAIARFCSETAPLYVEF